MKSSDSQKVISTVARQQPGFRCRAKIRWAEEIALQARGDSTVSIGSCWIGIGFLTSHSSINFHPYFPAAGSEMPDHKSSPNARVNQPISNGLSWLMGVTGTQSSAVSGVPRTSP
jgi:hypothetical protein